MSINELEMKCQELRELQRLIEEAQAEAETIKDAIKAHMGDSETAYAGEYKDHVETRHHRQNRHHGLEKGNAGGRPGIHPADHRPEVYPCIRKAPCASPGKHQHKKP